MKKQIALFLFVLSLGIAGLALWKTGEGETAEKISIPSNTWVSVRTTGDGNASLYGSAGLPRPRGWQQASFDLETREVVIFGGSSSTYMSDTWTFNLNEKVWHIRRPHPDLTGPCRRDNHNLVYDPVGKVHWLFNGIAYPDKQPGCSRGATWIYDRAKNHWSKVSVSGDRNHRLAPGIAYNPERREFLQFGGGAVNLSNTTVRFDIAKRRWHLIRTNPSPPPRTNIEGGLVYDRAHKVFVLFGGKGSKGVLNDTWTFDPATEKWQRKNPSVSPPARDVHAMVYDEARETVILYGGRRGGNLNDTWIYHVGRDEWKELKNTGEPPALSHHSAVYDPFNDVIIIVNGRDTLIFRYEPSSVTRTSSKLKDSRPVTLLGDEPEKQTSRPSARNFPNEKIIAQALGRNANQERAIDDAPSISAEKSVEIPLRAWIARPLPGRGKGPWGRMKHLRLALNLKNRRTYFLGGDYAGQTDVSRVQKGALASGRNEVFSYSIAGNDWRLEHPYCGSAGAVQPSHPDEVGWVYDTKRNVFWMLPGYMGGDQGVCPDSRVIRGQIMTFDPETRKWDWPKRKNSGGSVGNKKFAQYDAKKDQIIRFSWTGSVESEVYDIQKDSWSIKRHGGRGYQIGQEYTAMDEENRRIYVIAPKESRLFVYDMDKRDFHDLGQIPAPSLTDHTNPVWDSINKVLLWPQIANRTGIITLFAYDPTSKQWEKMPMNQPNGLTVTGADAIFDPVNNALMVLGGTRNPPTQHLFLYRYGLGRR